MNGRTLIILSDETSKVAMSSKVLYRKIIKYLEEIMSSVSSKTKAEISNIEYITYLETKRMIWDDVIDMDTYFNNFSNIVIVHAPVTHEMVPDFLYPMYAKNAERVTMLNIIFTTNDNDVLMANGKKIIWKEVK